MTVFNFVKITVNGVRCVFYNYNNGAKNENFTSMKYSFKHLIIKHKKENRIPEIVFLNSDNFVDAQCYVHLKVL